MEEFAMKKKVILGVKIGLVAVLICAVTAGGWKLLDYHKGATDYAEAASVGFAGVDLDALKNLPAGSLEPSSSEASAFSDPDGDSDGEDPAPSAPPEESPEPDGPAPDPSEPAADPAEPNPEPQPVDEYAQALAQLDLEALRQVNPDVIGWISIPGTDVFYPIMKTDNNQHYLNYTWKNEGSSVGAIFMESTCEPDLSNFNTIIYGHQMMDGSMFGGLHQYSNFDYCLAHPSIYIVVDAGVYRYDIFSAFEVGVRDLIYRLDIEESNLQQDLIDLCLSRSVLTADHQQPELDENSRLLTLSTCTGWGYSTRWVVVAECAMRPESAE